MDRRFRLLILLVATSTAGPVVAQESDQACTRYAACALRLEADGVFFQRTRLIRGEAGDEVARSLRSEAVRILFEGHEDAWPHYEAFVRNSRHASGWEWSALAFMTTGLLLSTRNYDNGGLYVGLAFGGISSAVVASSYGRGARNSMSRAIWWHNASLTR